MKRTPSLTTGTGSIAAFVVVALAASPTLGAQATRPVRYDGPPVADTTRAVQEAEASAPSGRESFSYTGRGRRDPFASLIQSGGELRPLLTDLRLVTVLVAAERRNSVAIMRDLTTKEQYRRRTGETLGRMRVAHIAARRVIFTINEFGYSRQEELTYTDSTTLRTR